MATTHVTSTNTNDTDYPHTHRSHDLAAPSTASHSNRSSTFGHSTDSCGANTSDSGSLSPPLAPGSLDPSPRLPPATLGVCTDTNIVDASHGSPTPGDSTHLIGPAGAALASKVLPPGSAPLQSKRRFGIANRSSTSLHSNGDTSEPAASTKSIRHRTSFLSLLRPKNSKPKVHAAGASSSPTCLPALPPKSSSVASPLQPVAHWQPSSPALPPSDQTVPAIPSAQGLGLAMGGADAYSSEGAATSGTNKTQPQDAQAIPAETDATADLPVPLPHSRTQDEEPPTSTNRSSRPQPSATPPNSSTSLRDIRKSVLHKTTVPSAHRNLLNVPQPNLSTSSSVDTALAALSISQRPNGTLPSLMQPRSAVGRVFGDEEEIDGERGPLGPGDEEANEASEDDENDLAARRRRTAQSRRMTMLDFLASGPPDDVFRGVSAGGPSGLTIPTSASSPMSSSLHRQAASQGRRDEDDQPLRSPRRRPQSMIAQSPTKRLHRNGSDERCSGDDMTMLDFLAGAPLNGSSAHRRNRSRGHIPDDVRNRLDQQQLQVVVKSMTDILTMFGSTQTSANYSLSGTVSVSLPRPREKPQPSREDRSTAPSPSPERQPSVERPNQDPQGDSDSPTTHGSHSGVRRVVPPMVIKSLMLTFAGHSIYADLSGRFSGIKLCEVQQELLTDGATLPLETDLQSAEAANSDEPLNYEIQFSINVPGWLPASTCSRFGATFYNVSATAVVLDGVGAERTVTSSSSLEAPRCESPEAIRRTAELETAPHTLGGGVTPPHRETPSGEPEGQSSRQNSTEDAGPSRLHLAASDESAPVGQSAVVSRVPTVKQKKKGSSWLSKRAKQLSLKARSNSPVLAEEEHASLPRKPAAPPVANGSPPRKIRVNRPDRPGRGRLPDGTLIVKSNKQLVIIKRCRDVVPVPVARMAIVGDDLPEGAQDSPTTTQRSASASSTVANAGASSTKPSTVPPMTPVMQRDLSSASQDRDGGRLAAQGPVPTSSITQSTSADERPAANATEGPNGRRMVSGESTDRLTPSDVGQGNGLVGPTARQELPSPAATEALQPASRETGLTRQTMSRSSGGPPPLPLAPSAFNAPTDPAKFSAAARLPSAPVRTSSAIAHNADGIPLAGGTDTHGYTGASRPLPRSGPPMRHFLHRPILHPPADSGMEEGEGLPFSLTISVPSHVQVQTANVLTFGVQVEVGRTSAWSQVREKGGLRLREMELVCLQTERHTSIPSRTFCATFPVPPEPKVSSKDLPVLPDFTHPLNNRPIESAQEMRVRSAYDQQAVLTNIHLMETGRLPPPDGNEVERVKTTAVGPPPDFQREKQSHSEQQSKGKGKERAKDRGRGADSAGANPGPSRQSSAVRLPQERQALFGDSTVVPASSGRVVASAAATGPGRPAVPATSASSGSSEAQAAGAGLRSGQPTRGEVAGPSALSTLLPPLPVSQSRGTSPSRVPRQAEPEASSNARNLTPLQTSPREASSPTAGPSSSNSPVTPRRAGRGRRAYEATMRGLSAFATAMMDVGYEETTGGQQASSDPFLERDQPHASYSFEGEDGHGVDLTKGRIRMTVNLPLVSSSASMARRDQTPQLVSDYESPHLRIRHKLKVKLGFGFDAKPLGGEGDWGQALVMCVPVRFSEAPPKEVREQFAPLPITVTSAGPNGASLIQPVIQTSDLNSAPVLPAYTQLFRDDGSRLNEAEDLPAYPGPRRPLPLSTRPSRPHLHNRGSVTGPLTPRLDGAFDDAPRDGEPLSSTSPSVPILHSLAPEQILDDAIQGLTDPDESMAAIREQEREMQEMQEGDEHGTFGAQHIRPGGGDVEIDEEDDGDDDNQGSARTRGGVPNEEDTVVVGGGVDGDGHAERIREMEEELGI